MPLPYELAKAEFAARQIDTEDALRVLGDTAISVHCWQGDDAGGFENASAGTPGGGLAVTGHYPGRTRIGLDYFDASIHRVAAWVIGIRATQQALLLALLQPAAELRGAEETGDHTRRLALLEDAKTLPWGVVWKEFCARHDVPSGITWMDDVKNYENQVTSARI